MVVKRGEVYFVGGFISFNPSCHACGILVGWIKDEGRIHIYTIAEAIT